MPQVLQVWFQIPRSAGETVAVQANPCSLFGNDLFRLID